MNKLFDEILTEIDNKKNILKILLKAIKKQFTTILFYDRITKEFMI